MKFARAQRGFTLLEVILAVVILASALGLLLGMLSRGMHQVTQSASESEATMYAQSLLDQVGTLEMLEPETRDGEFADGRYRWHLQIAPTNDPAPPPAPEAGAPPGQAQAMPTDGAPILYRVTLDVQWGQAGPAQHLRFETLRVRAPPASGSEGEQAIDAAAAGADDSRPAR